MTTEQIIGLIAVSVVGMLAFFLKATFSSVSSRLDKVEAVMNELLAELRVANTNANNHAAEIAILRQRMHDMSNTVQILKSTQERCKACNNR